MNRWARGGVALCLGFGLTVAAINVAESNFEKTEASGKWLGPPDFDRFCRHEYGDRAKAIHPGVGAFGWRCWVMVNRILTTHGVDAETACAEQYGSPAYANMINLDDPYGWECRRGPKSAG